jgi:hypothetical protein
MRKEYINVADKWGIVVCFDYNVVFDNDELWSIMRSFGMSQDDADEALRVLSHPNTGLCISNDGINMSVIFISKSTSPSEFYSTAIHECIHVADSILDWYGESWHGEPSAYLVGFMTKEIVEMIGEPCR